MSNHELHAATTIGPDPDRGTHQSGVRATRHEDFGPYRILEVLGEGGFGIVYLAEQAEPVRRVVAVKVIKPGMDTHAVLSRFDAERQALALMDHPGIARVLDAGTTPAGRPYFAMDLVRGLPLTEYCDRNRLSTRERLELFVEVCLAVQHAHQKGIIHRDLKPSNILVTAQDARPAPKVIDFGIAKAMHGRLAEHGHHTVQGQFIGTPEYTSPEQAGSEGLDVDTRSDIYSLGVVLYEMLTGVLPIDSSMIRGSGLGAMSKVLRDADPPKPSTRLAALSSTVAETPVTPGTPALSSADDIARRRRTDPRSLSRQLRGDLDWIVMKAMDKDRTRRYDSAGSLAADIQRHLINEPVIAGPPTTTYRVRKFLRRNRLPVAAASVVLIMLVAGLTATSVLYRRAEHQRLRAQDALAAEASQRTRAEQALEAEASQRTRAEKALEAVEAQRKRAQLESQKLTVTVDFLNDMFSSISPSQAKGREVTVREVLDTAAENITPKLGGQPEVEANIREILGETYHNLSRYTDAEGQMRQALEARLRVLPEDDPSIYRLYSKLGATLISQRKNEEAEVAVRKAYEGRLKALGPDSEETLGSLSLLAMLQQDKGDFAGAEETVRKVIAGQTAALGAGNRATLESRCSLADILHTSGRDVESEKEAAEIVKVSLDSLGPDDPMTLQAQSIHGASLYDLGRYADAEQILRPCADAKIRVLGPGHAETLTTLNIFGLTLKAMDKLEDAQEVAARVLEQSKQTLGLEHPSTLTYMNNLASVMQLRGQLDEAEQIYRDALAVRQRVSGPKAVGTLSVLNNLGLVLRDKKQYDEALPILEEVRAGVEAALPANHWMIGASRTFVGQCLTDLKRYEEAEARLLSGWEQLSAGVGPSHPRAKRATDALAKLYEVWGKPEQAAEWKAKGAQAPAAPAAAPPK